MNMLEPATLSARLSPGEGITETKTVTITIPEKLDILFSYDLTGSMAGIIDAAKANTADLITRLQALGSDINYGVVSYMDYPHQYDSYGYFATYGNVGDYAYRLDLPITNDTSAVLNAVNGLILGGGGDSPQDYTRILYESYANPDVAWREGSRRVLINFADSLPHDNNVNEGVPGQTGELSLGGDPGRDEIMFTEDDLDLQTVLAEMAENKVTLIAAQRDTTFMDYWTYWSGLTGGQAFLITSATFVDDVVNAVTSTLTTVTGLTLAAAPGFEDWIESVTPESFTGAVTDPIPFELWLRVPDGTAAGVYNFTIRAVDAAGFEYGEQAVQIEVTARQAVIKAGGGIDVEYVRAFRIKDNTGYSYYVYPVRFIFGTLEADGPLAEGFYHTLIHVQNTMPVVNTISIKVSVPHTGDKPPITTKGLTLSIDPFESIQISGSKINELLKKTPYYNFPFLSGSVLIASKHANLGVSAAYTFYQVSTT
jgi:hypothetical protein